MAERRVFGNASSWVKTLYSRTLRRFPGAPLPFRRTRVRVRLADGSIAFCRLDSSDFGVFFEMMTPIRTGDYERVTKGDLGPIRRIVDLGSNVGLSIRYWQRFWPDAAIVAVEPDPGNLEVCRANIAAGPKPENVVVVQACVGAYQRFVSLDRSGAEWTFRMTDTPGPNSERIPVLTVGDVIAKLPASDAPIDLLKMDIEGAEQEVWGGDMTWAANVRNMIVEIHPPYSEAQFLADVSKLRTAPKLERMREAGEIKLFLLSWNGTSR